MASFVANLFPGAGRQDKPDLGHRPSTPVKNNFTTPVSTPQGSPSKRTVPPGANELPTSFDGLKLASSTNALESPPKLGRPQTAGSPLSPGKTNIQAYDGNSSAADDSIIHKGMATAGTPLRRQGQENTPPVSARGTPVDTPYQPSPAALSRQEPYLPPRDKPTAPVKKFNTSRGLTPEELEILQKPNVKRLVNVTQLCE